MKIFIVNTKGGCGKSTCCYQIVSPYCFAKNNNKKPIIVDLDNMNDESSSYSQSKIFDSQKTSSIDIQLIGQDRDAIFDTGAGDNGKKNLNNLINTGLIEFIDLFIIPLTSGTEATVDAFYVYNSILKNVSKAKIMFVFSDCFNPEEFPLKEQFSAFYKYVENNNIKIQEPIPIVREPSIVWSQRYGLTAYELGDETKEKSKKIELRRCVEMKDFISAEKKSKELLLIKLSMDFRKYLVDKVFPKIDEFLGENNER